MPDTTLPAAFADLQPYADTWVLPTLEDRLQLRLATPMDELYAFYDAVFPRAEAAMEYLDGFPLADLPEPEHNLMKLLYALSVVAVATVAFQHQRDPNSGDTWVTEVESPAS